MTVSISCSPSAAPQDLSTSSDPLLHGSALLIGISSYKEWGPLHDVPLQINALKEEFSHHFDHVDVAIDLDSNTLRRRIEAFLRVDGNDADARLLIYYAGHGYTETIDEKNTNEGYITGIDTPVVDGTKESYNRARPLAVNMGYIREHLSDSHAKSILFVFDSCFAGTFLPSGALLKNNNLPWKQSSDYWNIPPET
jgi:hypothetical protein